MPGAKWLAPIVGVVVILSVRLTSDASVGNTAVFGVFGAVMVLTLAGGAKGVKFTHLEASSGRVIAIVPAYNEDLGLLHCCVRALLRNTRVDHIYVVDDGSKRPPLPIQDRRITWIRQDNAGKRHAQVTALEAEREAGHRPDFIVTVDSDSVISNDAVEQCLRAMSDPRVQACTGMVVCHSRRGPVSLLLDLELAMWCLVGRSARSIIGLVAPCSGALSMYRAEIMYDNIPDYLTSGNCGDDRRLTHYALLKGKVVGVNEAYVRSDMPTTTRGAYKQRVRWYQSYWRYTGWELKHLSGPIVWWRVWTLFGYLLSPLLYFTLAVALISGGPRLHELVFHLLPYVVVLMYLETLSYPLMHPVAGKSRWATWLVMTPLMVPWSIFMVKPALAHALLTCRETKWGTR